MSFKRRQLLQILSYAFGSSVVLSRKEFAIAAQNLAQPPSPARLRRQLLSLNQEECKWRK